MTDRRSKIGLPPGSLFHMGEARTHEVDVSLIEYGPDHFYEGSVKEIKEICECPKNKHISWVDIDGIHESDVVKQVGETFGLHPLVMEDIMNPYHRPKIEVFDNYIHFTMKMLTYDHAKKIVHAEQVSFILGESWVLSFQERQGDIFDSVRERIRTSKGRIRMAGPDFLVYYLTDIIVDHYFLIVEELEDEIERMELKVLRKPDDIRVSEIQKLKKDLLFLRKSILPVRDAVNSLHKGCSPLIQEGTTPFFKDVYDHCLQMTDSIDLYREMLNTIMEVYHSSLSNKLNRVMKVLTVISTIFIPLTFIVGVYGMNFKYMPEIDWKYGYLYSWILMIGVVVTLVYILRRNKWL